jgi:DNA polymerase-3 subunit epsilon
LDALRIRLALLRKSLPEPIRQYLIALRDNNLSARIASSRLVVLDTETTGLDFRNDNILQIGAVALQNCEIVVADSFECIIQSEHAGSDESISIHGLRPSVVQKGLHFSEVILPFLEYLRGDVLVGHHISFDRKILGFNLKRYYPVQIYNRCIDTAHLAVRLEKPGKSPEEINWKDYSLDALCERYNIRSTDRHTAAGDAFITAQLFLKLLNRFDPEKKMTLADLAF